MKKRNLKISFKFFFLVRLNTSYRCDYFLILGFEENLVSQLTWFDSNNLLWIHCHQI